ncbi:GNAT family N-acetyltransferase [Embleya scabrispora]|uniref:GNAT family N-acetyltransferase n=1 Tax=Embleya scabrispora TaxID=159449 RepID=UPI00099EACBB|nr:GNAT family N-acetyltransferase [Embleya scabrispora]MYS81608.1 hypothetical protein [Streptomyces sp. SID5474]
MRFGAGSEGRDLLVSNLDPLQGVVHAGLGLASQLVQQALTDVRASGQRIVPVCPYAAKFLKMHDEFDDITDPVTPEIRQCPAAALSR